MNDSLFNRAQLAMEESCRLRQERKALTGQRDQHMADLRCSVFETAMLRSEIKAHRDNREEQGRLS
jgi:hypothetical protein